MVTGRYSGYDEYEGSFGALGSGATRTATRGAGRSLAPRHGRLASATHSDSAFGLHARAFPSARRTSGRRPGGGSGSALSTNGYERRERYLSERASKRRLKPVDGDGLDDEEEGGTPQPPKQQQIWLPTKNFSFRQRAGKLDTRTIARLDLQKIVATTDVETIQRHLENLAYSDVTLEDVQQYSDAYFLKLFQIAQLTVEYLLNVQDSLASHCENLETQCEGIAEECQSLESENQKVESEITALKKEIRQKQSTLATFEVMLLNTSAAKRASHGLRAMQQQKIDQENDSAVLNILGSSAASTPDAEIGAVPLVSACVLCGKKFISPEYLVRHQQKKHGDHTQSRKKKKKKRRSESDASDSLDSSRSGSDSGKTKKRREPRTTPLPADVVQALNDRNEMTKQLMELQFQLRSEKEKRAEEARQAEQQQALLANQLTAYMTKLQDTLVDMEKKQEQSKHEMMRYTQEALERAKNEQTERAKKQSHAGRLESDDDDGGARNRKKATTAASDEIEKRILDSLLRAQTEIHHKNSELEQANRKLQTKLRRKARQMQCEPPPPTTLMSMTAMEAQRFGIDLGFGGLEDTPRVSAKPVAVEDKPVQTDEERDDPRKKRMATVSQQVQTDIAPVETGAPKPEVKPAVRQPPPPLKRAESKITAPVIEPPKPAPQPKNKADEEVKPSPVAVPKEPLVAVPEVKKPESKLQHAAHLVGKVARGFLTRRTLENPSNWLVTLPRASLFHALSENELNHLTHAHGGALQDVTVEIEDDMTANDLRVAFAEALSGQDEDDEATVTGVVIVYHRILLHHRRTGQEISGDQFIYHLRNQLDVEIIPSFEAAETHVDQVLGFHEELSSQVQDIRRQSMELTLGDVSLALRVRHREDAEELAHRAATRVQSIVRRFLASRTVQMMEIDRLVEARLVAMRSLTSSPRARTMSAARSQRQLTRSASIAVIRNEAADERTVTNKAEQIHVRLADLVKQKTGVDTRTKSAKWSRGQLSNEDYDRHVEEIEQDRKALSPEVQQRIAEISQRVDQLLDNTYDPVVAKQEEDMYVAASRIQLAVQVAVARKKLKQLLGQKEESASRHDSHATIEQDKQSVPSREEDASDEEATEEKKETESEQERKKDDSSEHGDDDAKLDVEELDDVDIKRLADAYEQAAAEKALPPPRTPTPQPEQKPTVVEAKPKPVMAPRPGTPPPSREDLLGHSPRPLDESRVISPFSKTPLMSRRAAVTRRGSGYDNAR